MSNRQEFDEIAEAKQSAYHSLHYATAKAIYRSLRKAEQNIINDLSKYMPPNIADPKAWMKREAGGDAMANLRLKAMQLPEPQRSQWLAKLNKPSWRAQVTNKHALYNRLLMEETVSRRSIDATMRQTASKVAQEGYARQMFEVQKGVGMGWSFSLPNMKQAEAMAKRSLHSGYTQNLTKRHIKQLNEEITAGILSGKSEKDIAKAIHESAGGELWEAKRLVRTEITGAAAEGELQAIKDMEEEFDVKMRYRFYATLDERTCPICGELDMQDFDREDAQPGVNSPPMHPNCRCVIQAVTEDDLKEKAVRRGRNEEGKSAVMPQGMGYKEWKAEYVDKPKAEAAIRAGRHGDTTTAGNAGGAAQTTASTTAHTGAANITKTAYSNEKLNVKGIENNTQREFLEKQTKGKDIPLYRGNLTEQEIKGRGLSKEQKEAREKLVDRIDNTPSNEVSDMKDHKEVTTKHLNELANDVTAPIIKKTPGAEQLIKEFTTKPSQFNKPLQGEVSKFVPSDIEKIDAMTNLISQSELKEGIIVYSGGDGRNIYSANFKPGDIMIRSSFQSSTAKIEVAQRFAIGEEIPIIEKILIPPSKGVALPIGNLSSASKPEWEIILQRGLERKYVGTEGTYKGIPILVFRVV